jgi:hypothetical protein
VKVTLSIICILIISVSVRGLRSLIDSIDNDNPTPEDIKKGLYLVLGTVFLLALLLLILINIYI